MNKYKKIVCCILLTFTSTFVTSQILCEKNVEENIICSNQELNALSNNFLKLYSEYKVINSNFSESTKSELNNKLQQCAEDVSCISGSLISSINILKNNLENSQKENNKSTIQEQVPVSDKNTNGNNPVVIPSEKNSQIKDQTPDTWDIVSLLKDPYVYGAIIYLILFGFLNFAKNNPDAALFVTNILYWSIGFPILLTWMLIKIVFNKSKSNYVDLSAGSGSSKNEVDDKKIDHPDWETVDIEFQETSGGWKRITSIEYRGNEQEISHGMKSGLNSLVHRGSGSSGRVRAKGRRTKTIYDIS